MKNSEKNQSVVFEWALEESFFIIRDLVSYYKASSS